MDARYKIFRASIIIVAQRNMEIRKRYGKIPSYLIAQAYEIGQAYKAESRR